MVFSKTSESEKPKLDGYHYFNGTLHLKQLPMGLASAPGAFHLLMELVFKFFSYKAAVVYLDDETVFGKTFEVYLLRFKQVFAQLEKRSFKTKGSKYNLFKERIHLWGMLCHKKCGCGSREGGNRRVMESPSNWKEIRAELVLVGLYKKVFPGFWKDFRTFIPITEDGQDVSLHKRVRRCFTRMESGTAISAQPGLLKKPP